MTKHRNCIKLKFLLLLYFSGSCAVWMNDLPDFEPLFLLENYTTDYLHAFVLPNSYGYLNFNAGDKFLVSCPDEGNLIVINGEKTKTQLETAQCEKGTIFKITGKSVNLTSISCAHTTVGQTQTTNNNCGAQQTYQSIKIGFKVSEKFINHLEVCYDRTLKRSLYSHQILGYSITGGRYNLSSSKFNFFAGDFYDKIQVAELYTKATQMKNINTMLSLPETDTRYIDDSSESKFFLSKGHYSAKADFFYGIQQTLTYYYVNAAPQWYTFNSGNWNTLEIKCREFATSKTLDLDVITGSYGVSKLLSNSDTMTQLYLSKVSDTDKAIPVPRFYYKIVYDQKSNAGVAFVGVNNPYMFQPKEDIICVDICDQIQWIGDLDRKNIELGYLYCCDVNDLKKTIEDIPVMNITSLLK